MMINYDLIQNSALIIMSLYVIHAGCKAYGYDPCIAWHYSRNKLIDSIVGMVGALMLLLFIVDCFLLSLCAFR